MPKKQQTKVTFKEGIVYVNGEARLRLDPSAKVDFEEFEGNVVAAMKNIGQFVSPRYFIIQKDGKVCQRRTATSVGEVLKSTKAFVNRIKKLI